MKLTKKLLMFFMCFVAIFGLACISVGLNVDATDQTITINYGDTFTPAFPTSGGNTTATSHTVNGFSFSEKYIYKGGSSNYLMFVQNQGFLYNNASLGTIKSVAVTYSSGTSTSAMVGVYFGTSALSTYTKTSNKTIAGQSKTDTFTNTTAGCGFFQLSTSNKNCQITKIVITYNAGGGEQLTTPTSFSILNNTVSIDSVTNATGYAVGLFASADAETPVYTISSTTTSVEIKDVPQNQQYYAKVKAVGDSTYSDSDYTSSASAVAFTNTAISEYTPTYVKDNKANQDAAPWIYYKVAGVVKSVLNTAYVSIQIADTLETSTYLSLKPFANSTDYNFQVGDSVTVTGYKTGSMLDGISVINHSANYTGRFESLQTTARLSVDYSTSGVLGNGWVKVTNAATLKVGDQLIIGTAQKAMSTTQNTSNRAETDLYISSPSSSVQVLTLGGSEGAWTFYTGSGYLNAPCVDGKNNMTTEVFATEADITANAKWTVSIADGNATIVSTGGSESSRRTIKYNSSSKIFSCYGSGQTAVALYRYESTEVIQYGIKKDGSNNNQLAMQFGGIIEKGLYDIFAEDTNVEFGVLYCKSSDLGANTFASLIASVNNNEIEFDAMLTNNNIFKKNDIARINEAGDPDDEGSYYQFGVTISNISLANIVTEVTAVCYVKYNGTYYLMNQKAYSVKTIAAAYVNAENTSAYTDHLGMLNWLKNYTVE